MGPAKEIAYFHTNCLLCAVTQSNVNIFAKKMSVIGKMERGRQCYIDGDVNWQKLAEIVQIHMEGKSLNWSLLDSTSYLRETIDLI